MDVPSDEFLDLACLVYTPDDAVERRDRARAILGAHPDLARANAWTAAALCDLEALKHHIGQDPESATQRGGPRGWPAILYLCYSRVGEGRAAPEAARLLLSHGADPNSSFRAWESDFTALTGALGEGEQGPECQPPHEAAEELVTLLLDAGADPNDGQGLYNTMFRPDDRWLRLFLSRGLDANSVLSWDMRGPSRPRTLDFLLSHAVDAGYADRIELLLSHGANASGCNPYNGRPLFVNAILAGRERVIELLRDAGAGPGLQTEPQRLLLACVELDASQARRILSGGEVELDPVFFRDAAKAGRADVVGLLLDLGAPIDSGDHNDVTALHEAAFQGHADVVRLLLERGASQEIADRRFGSKALGWATHAGQSETARLLREAAGDRD